MPIDPTDFGGSLVRVCGMHVGDPGAQRHRFWLAYAELPRRAEIRAGPESSRGAGPLPTDLRERFADVLADLDSVGGLNAARVWPPVPVRGALDGTETGIWQFMRSVPLETVELTCEGGKVVVPTMAEALRIKAVLILKGEHKKVGGMLTRC